MKLKILSNRTIKSLMVILEVVLLIVSAIPSSAIEYHFEEDFSNPENGIWEFGGTDWSAWGNRSDVVSIDPLARITNGELIFEGDFIETMLDNAYTQENTIYGSWSFDVFVPSNASNHNVTDFIWSISLSQYTMGVQAGQSFFGEWVLNFYDDYWLNFVVLDSDPGDSLQKVHYVPNAKKDTYQHYDLIRTKDRFYIVIDDEVVTEFQMPSTIGTEINYLNFITVQGSKVRFDNLQISSDYDGKLSELGIGESSSDARANFVNTAIILGIITATTATAGVTYNKIKKKD